MHHYSLLQLREMADQLSIVANILETNPFYLRSKQIRQVDKALVGLEILITPEFVKQARFWKETFDGLQILKRKLDAIDNTQMQIANLEHEIEDLKSFTRSWHALEDAQRDIIVQHAKRSNEFLKNQGDIKEASVIDRYNRSIDLKNLLLYADKVPHLCDAIFHYTQKERYNQNLLKLREKIEHINSQIKIVKRGFWMALGLCLLVATIPISLPFAITLWQRKQRLESHLNIYQNLERKELNRLALAEEGFAVTQEIQNIVGQVSYDTMKNLLLEAKELKSEFHNGSRFLSVCAVILNYIDTNKDSLVSLFGNLPDHPKDRFGWLVKNVNQFETAHRKLESLQDERRELYLRKKQTTKGYEREILTHSIEQLTLSMTSMMRVPLSEENKILFAEMCIFASDLFKKIRDTIFYVSQNYDVNLSAWNIGQKKIQEYSQMLALFVLDAEIIENKNKQSLENSPSASDTIQHAIVAQHLNEGL